MYGTPRSEVTRWMASAMVRACCSDSMTQGPLMRKSLPRPTGTLPISKGWFTDLFDHTQEKGGQRRRNSCIRNHIDVYAASWRFEMILLSLSSLVLSAGLQMQPQTAAAPAVASAPVA